MKKLVFGLLMLLSTILIATGCQKFFDVPTTTSSQSQDVSFDINSVFNHGLKNANSDTIICNQAKATYVLYKIDGGPFMSIPVFYDMNNVPWTNTIKLTTGTHILNEFLVYTDNNTPNNTADDILLEAVPHSGSVFAQYVSTTLDYTFTVATDKKSSIKLDVVCYQPQYYTKFGFTYFNINEIAIRQLWFMGDFCIKDKSQYSGSPYATQTNWGGGTGFIDVPAIAKVELWENNTLINTFMNSAQGEKINVVYVDNLRQTDVIELKLFILVKQGTQFNYVQFGDWTFNDISTITQGSDGVIDYVLGSCYDPSNPPDYVFSPWMNLPSTATYQIVSGTPGTLGGYVDASLTNIPTGYDIHNGTYASNCADHQVTINNTPYNMNVYSSLYQSILPTFAQGTKWNKLNWLYNHLNYFSGYHWYDLQGAIWLLDNPSWNGVALAGVPNLTSTMTLMKTDMDAYGSTYVPAPGGWAAIIFIPVGTPPNATQPTIQTMIVKIDP